MSLKCPWRREEGGWHHALLPWEEGSVLWYSWSKDADSKGSKWSSRGITVWAFPNTLIHYLINHWIIRLAYEISNIAFSCREMLFPWVHGYLIHIFIPKMMFSNTSLTSLLLLFIYSFNKHLLYSYVLNKNSCSHGIYILRGVRETESIWINRQIQVINATDRGIKQSKQEERAQQRWCYLRRWSP